MATERFHVRIAKESLTFCSAHFITYAGHVCERLHGHNYRLAVEVHGALDENAYVVDFVALREALRTIVDRLDHRMLLPTMHARIQLQQREREIEVTFEDRRWVFPIDDCVLLPVANTTAELIAQYIAQQLLGSFPALSKETPYRMVVAVDECEGQWGVYEWCSEEWHV